MRHWSQLLSLRTVVLVSAVLLMVLSGQICRPTTPPDTGGDECTYTAITSDINTDTTLSAGCYDLNGIISVNAALTISPGTTVRCSSGSMLMVDSAGSLSAVGTAAEPITFAGATASRGFWGGIRFLDSGSSNNRLEYVTIEHGGSTGNGAVMLSPGSGAVVAQIAHCTIRESAGYGVSATGNVNMSGFASNTLTQNTQGPCMIDTNLVQYLDTASTYQGNDVNAVVLSFSTVTDDQVWPALDVDYQASSIQVAGSLTLSPEVTIAFGSGGGMNVQSTGSLRALGAPGREVVLTGTTATAGSWIGLSYTNTTSPANNLSFVRIEYAGSGAGSLVLDTAPVVVSATNCTFAHSSSCGAYVSTGATLNPDFTTANTFTDVAGGALCP